METKPDNTAINTPDVLWGKINASVRKNVPEKTVVRDGAYAYVSPENPQFVVGAALRQLFVRVLNQVRSEIQLPAENDGAEDINTQRVAALSRALREKMGNVVAGEIPSELRNIRNLEEVPVESAESVIGDTGKNIGHFVGLVMEDVFQDKAA